VASRPARAIAGSRKDHYEAATNFWRVFQEIMERRFRGACDRCWQRSPMRSARSPTAAGARPRPSSRTARRSPLFFSAIDAGFGAFAQGKPLDPEALKKVTHWRRAVAAAPLKGDDHGIVLA